MASLHRSNSCFLTQSSAALLCCLCSATKPCFPTGTRLSGCCTGQGWCRLILCSFTRQASSQLTGFGMAVWSCRIKPWITDRSSVSFRDRHPTWIQVQKQSPDPLLRQGNQRPGSSASGRALLPNLQLWALRRAKSPLALSSNNRFWSAARASCQFQSHSTNARGRVY